MTPQEQYLQQKLTSILQPGEQVITQGVAWAPGLGVFGSLLYGGWARYFIVVLTAQRLIVLRMKGQSYPGRFFFSKKIVDVGSEERHYQETISLRLSELLASVRLSNVVLWALGWSGMKFKDTSGKEIYFIAKRSSKAFSNQRDFYQTIFARISQESKKQLPAGALSPQ